MTTNNFSEMHDFPNIGFLIHKFNENELKSIKDEIKKIQSDFTKATPYNEKLAGNIQNEFELKESRNFTEKLIFPLLDRHNTYYNLLKNVECLNENKDLKLDGLWVNFQKKHEFNPLHHHAGVYSFVLWIDIPYDIQDEINMPSSINSGCKSPGHFNFVYTNSLGQISPYAIPADKTYNNTLCLFPAYMGHFVNPFYTSDKFRITVSGNFSFDVKNKI